MPNYKNGKIYKMVSPSGLTYIGSTTQSLAVRKGGHKKQYVCWKNGTDHYITSFELFEDGDVDITLLELFPCDNKEQLHARERYYIESLHCVNKCHPMRSKKEYREANKEAIAESTKQYFIANKDKILEYKKKYLEENKDKIREYQRRYRESHKDESSGYNKQYRMTNKEKLSDTKRKYYRERKAEASEYQKQYREQNKEKI